MDFFDPPLTNLDGSPLVRPELPYIDIVDASRIGCVETVKYMLENGHLWAMDMAMNEAAKNGHTEIVKLFLDAGVQKRKQGWACLETACVNNHVDIVKLLLDHKAWYAMERLVALWKSASLRHVEVVRLLIDAGSPVDNESVWSCAYEGGDEEILRMLTEACGGKPMSVPNQEYWIRKGKKDRGEL